jgi:hypothetical protein
MPVPHQCASQAACDQSWRSDHDRNKRQIEGAEIQSNVGHLFA